MTTSPPASTHGTIERTPDGGIVRFERILRHPIEEVWSSLTEPARIADWWPPFAADVTVDLRVGGDIRFEWPDADFPTMSFTITALDPPHLLEHAHTSPGSWMRYELAPTDDGTHLRATYFVPAIDMALERGDVVGLHYSLDRLGRALAGQRAEWDPEVFEALRVSYAGPSADPEGTEPERG